MNDDDSVTKDYYGMELEEGDLVAFVGVKSGRQAIVRDLPGPNDLYCSFEMLDSSEDCDFVLDNASFVRLVSRV